MKMLHFIILALLTTIVTGTATTTNTFALYLTESPMDPRILADGKGDWKQVKLSDTPLISESDIVSYDFTNHAITLRPGAIERFPFPPVSGTPFVIMANGERVYLGVLMTSASSFSRTLPTIVLDDYAVFACIPTEKKLHISRTYHAELPAGTPDPRSDDRIRKALEQKLK